MHAFLCILLENEQKDANIEKAQEQLASWRQYTEYVGGKVSKDMQKVVTIEHAKDWSSPPVLVIFGEDM